MSDNYSRLTTAAGIASLRTVPMSQPKAEAFAECLKANPYIAGVDVIETQPGSGRFYVAYLPADPRRQAEIHDQIHQENLDRAIEEYEGYDFEHVTGRIFRVTTLPDKKTGYRDTYTIDLEHQLCGIQSGNEDGCPHFRYRLKRAALICKHVIAGLIFEVSAEASVVADGSENEAADAFSRMMANATNNHREETPYRKPLPPQWEPDDEDPFN